MSEIIPFKKPFKLHDLVLRFLTSLGHKHDAEVYLKLFTSKKPESFAIVVLPESVLQGDLDPVLFEIRYLSRLSLFPVIVFQTSFDFLEKMEIETYFKRAKLGVSLLLNKCSEAEKINLIKEKIHKKLLPMFHIDIKANLVDELTALLKGLQTSKVLFLRKEGGIMDAESEQLYSIININHDYDEFVNSPKLNQLDKDLLKDCHKMMQACDHKIFISAVSPNNLLRELFTVKGAGTLIQMGSKIHSFTNLDQVDPKSLKRLLEMSFEKKLNDEFYKKEFQQIYIEENYMGAALLQSYKNMTYLSKFAVGTEARGLGVGRDLWNEITKNHKAIFWRSDPKKFITHWYIKQCDGMHKTENWIVYWKGVHPSEITNVIEFSLSQSVDLIG